MREAAPEKRRAVKGMFAAISPRYDLLNRLLSAGQDRRWRRRSVAMFSPGIGRVLDVAAGTGDLSAAWLADRSGALALATDFVPEMCALGAEKLGGHPRLLGYANADALALPFATDAFDGVMAAFGVRNFADLETGLAEMTRVLRPGGEMLILEFFPAKNPVLDRLFGLYFRRLLPLLGGWISGNRGAYEYLPRSVGDFQDREAFRTLLEELGLGIQNSIEHSGGVATAILAKKP